MTKDIHETRTDMHYHRSIILKLCKDILNLRGRITWDIPFHCPVDEPLAEKALITYDALNELYKELDRILLSEEMKID